MQKLDDRFLSVLNPLCRLVPDTPILAEYRASVLSLYRCPCCCSLVSSREQFCSQCGQAFDWTTAVESPVPLVLAIPRSDLNELRRYCNEGGQVPCCVDLRAIGTALDCALSKEVPGNE